MTRSTAAVLVIASVLFASSFAPFAQAQDAAESDAEEAPAPLPEPELTEPEEAMPSEPAPEPAPEEHEGPAILEHVGGRPPPAPPEHIQGEDEGHPANSSPELPPDIAFVTPGDTRTRQGVLALPGQSPPPPLPYGISVAGGFTRALIGPMATDFARIEERFEVRLPELGGFLIGGGAAQFFDDQNYVVELGPRVGYGVPFCDAGEVKCEGAVHVQPGVAFGFLGVQFDLNANLDLRLLIGRHFEVGITGSFSFIGGGNFLSLTGMLGAIF